EAITPDNPNNPLPPKEIHISAAIEASAQTKATTRDESTLTGPIDGTVDIPGIQFLHKDAAASEATSGLSFEGVSVITGTRIATGTTNTGSSITFNGSAPQYDQKENKNAYFVAYYPVRENSSSSDNTATWTIDGKTDILYAERYDAGTYIATITGGESPMTFKHALAQLEVVCMAEKDVSAEVMKKVWGQIQKIEISTLAKAKYKYSDQSFEFKDASDGTTAANIELLQKDYKTAFAAIDIPSHVATPSADNVVAAGMFAPAAENSTAAITLTITTKVDGADASAVTTNVTVQLAKDGTNKGFERGLKHTAILTFKTSKVDIEVTGTTITPWGTGYTGTGDVTPTVTP
ncbi:MAG: fimbrillin family protein, partial [Bacteroides sp.]|nr:fimbrillin family protein [Bacteroides sp.]